MRTYYIYKATNKINGKSYIGQAVNFSKRKNEHLHVRDDYHDPNSIFHKALDKYGADNFEWEIIGAIPGKPFADAFERNMIKKHNTFKPNGYNMTKGGDGGSMWNAIPVVRLTLDGKFVKRYDSAGETEDDGFYYNGVLKSCRDEITQTKGFIFMFEDEYKKCGGHGKREKHMAKNARAIYQCDINGNLIKKFTMISDAEKELGISHATIIGCATGRNKTCHGYIFVYPEDFPIKNIEERKKRVKGRKVAKVDKTTGEVIATYDRMTDAAKELGGSHKMIHKVLDSNTKTAYGYQWKSIS